MVTQFSSSFTGTTRTTFYLFIYLFIHPNMHGSNHELIDRVQALCDRVAILERKLSVSGLKSALHIAANIEHSTPLEDSFACSMYVKALAAGFRNTRFVRCPDDYYSWTLERRRAYLRAPSTKHLCKSIVMCNTRCEGEDSSDMLNSKYYCVIVQYHTKMKAEDLMRILKRLNAERGRTFGSRHFNFRLADECEGITGYLPNAVTPLGLKTPMPVVLDKAIIKLQPPVMWMGAGEVSLKWSVQIDDFQRAFAPIVGDVSPDL